MAGTRLIPLTQGAATIVNEEDHDRLISMGKWHLSSTGYAVRRAGRMTVRMHRVVNNTPDGLVTDHLNNNTLDNRKSNLRSATHTENSQNRKIIRGYCWDATRQRWLVHYKKQFYGRYLTEQEAQAAYRRAKGGVPYNKKRRKLWHLPTGITKQFGKYRVRPAVNGTRRWLGEYATLTEAESVLKNWREGGLTS